MDNDSLTGTLSKSETIQTTIVIPADGPSFLIPPAGKCRCKDIFSSSSICSDILNIRSLHIEKSFLWVLIHERAIFILYFITVPSWPVTYITPLVLWYLTASTSNIFPPFSVHTILLTTPTPFHLYSFLIFPKIIVTVFPVIESF